MERFLIQLPIFCSFCLKVSQIIRMFAPNRSMNMKIHRNLMLVCLLLMASISYAQSETIVVGKKADGTDLKAQCYTFPQRVETFSMSDKGDYLCVSFRETTKSGKYLKNKGEIGFYDTKSSQLLWKQPIDFSKSRITCLSEGVLMGSQFISGICGRFIGIGLRL